MQQSWIKTQVSSHNLWIGMPTLAYACRLFASFHASSNGGKPSGKANSDKVPKVDQDTKRAAPKPSNIVKCEPARRERPTTFPYGRANNITEMQCCFQLELCPRSLVASGAWHVDIDPVVCHVVPTSHNV